MNNQPSQTIGSAKHQTTKSTTSVSVGNQPSMVSSPPPPPPLSSSGGAKNHKVEGKNKKSLHQKQQQQQQCIYQQSRSQKTPQNLQRPSSSTVAGRNKKSSIAGSQTNPPSSSIDTANKASVNICSTLKDFADIAQELKADINRALAKQASHQSTDQPVEVVKLKNDILKLSGLETEEESEDTQSQKPSTSEDSPEQAESVGVENVDRDSIVKGAQQIKLDDDESPCPAKHIQSNDILQDCISGDNSHEPSKDFNGSSQQKRGDNNESCCDTSNTEESIDVTNNGLKTETILVNELDESHPKDEHKNESNVIESAASKSQVLNGLLHDESDSSVAAQASKVKSTQITPEELAPLNTRLDFESKLVTLTSSLKKHFIEVPHLLDPVCRKLVNMSDSISDLTLTCENQQAENRKLMLVKQKLENLCRELQKSNNSIRIESFDLIKAEQSKAKEQTTKIQSTLSGVIKLFDENQQRNMSLRQENQDLQTKLKSLLDHCDNWEKSIEAALRQRDIENRLLKTELAKANLLKNEEQEKFLGEKQELLQILSMMQEQQHRIEGQEAKLRSDLSSYASKYDECQAVISNGMNKFQTESKRMMKQIEKSKQDYKVLLTKYETNNRRTTQLLEEKQEWLRSLSLANKKIETLEKLCRALRDRKQEAKNNERVARNTSSKDHSSQQSSPEKTVNKVLTPDVASTISVVERTLDAVSNQDINEDQPLLEPKLAVEDEQSCPLPQNISFDGSLNQTLDKQSNQVEIEKLDGSSSNGNALGDKTIEQPEHEGNIIVAQI